MYRNVVNDFANWYEKGHRQILYVKGAYGVGKTWAVRDFATAFFGEQVYIDLTDKPDFIEAVKNFEQEEFDILLAPYLEGKNLNNTIIIFDEVQLTNDTGVFFYSFLKLHRNYTLCLIASTMEITEYEYHHKDAFNIIRMRPMTFEEYLIANKAHPFIAAISNSKNSTISPIEVEGISLLLRDFLLIGGMPGIVTEFIKTKNYDLAREKQLELIEKYETIIRKFFSSAMSQRCRRVWKSIPKQLLKDNKKFMYNLVDENARSREYQEATQNLCSLGLARKLPRLKTAQLPLEDNVDSKSFQLFLIDHGLLRALYKLPMGREIQLEDIFAEQDGVIAEQYIFQELSNKVGNIYYWTSSATARVPFVYEGEGTAIPVDVRFTPNNKAQNIKTFFAKNPDTEIAIKLSMEQVHLDGQTLNIPAYGLWNM